MEMDDYFAPLHTRNGKLRRMREKLGRLRASAESLGCLQMEADKIQTSHRNDKLSRLVSEIVDLEHEIEEMSRYNEVDRREMIGEIEKLSDERERDIIYYVYIGNMTLRAASRKMGIGYSNAKKIHGRAKENFLKNFM